MPFIVSYRKAIDAIRTVELARPLDPQTNQVQGTELATVDGITYVSMPDGADLPAQPGEIAASIEEGVTLTNEQREAIKAASPIMRFIAKQMEQQIRSLYSLDDELFFARIGVGAANGLYQPTAQELADMQNFGAYVEGVRQWGRAERAKYGI